MLIYMHFEFRSKLFQTPIPMFHNNRECKSISYHIHNECDEQENEYGG